MSDDECIGLAFSGFVYFVSFLLVEHIFGTFLISHHFSRQDFLDSTGHMH
jgi:hypothetical protein